MGSVAGNSNFFPQRPGFMPGFWAEGWNQGEEDLTPGKMEKGPTKLGTKGGKTGSVTDGGGKMSKMANKCLSCSG